jgi:hypothetical protein
MRKIGIAGAALTMLALGGAQAQPARVAAPARTAPAAIDARLVVAEMRKVLAANYVLPEMRPKLDAALAAGLARGRYDTSDPGVLAERINADMAAVAHDKHLGLHFDPAQAALIGTRSDDDRQDGPVFERMAQVRNHGLTEMKVLPGNIRYLAIDGFVWTGPETARAYDAAMQFLRGGDAVIIDLRRNGGGSPAAVQYAISHFLEPNRPIVTFHMGSSPPEPHSSLGELPAGRMVGKPLYVLTSGGSASAAEEFTGHVKGFKLGELIGANTAGAGFRNSFFAIPGGFAFSVSVGRAVLASTGSDWEGRGIAPDTPVDPAQALDVAQLHALRRLAATAVPGAKGLYEGMATLLAARIAPVATALPLQAYAGRFGERVISFEQGKLMFQRDGGPKLPLTALGPNLFAIGDDPGTKVQFAVAGTSATGFEMVRGDGSKVQAARSQ